MNNNSNNKHLAIPCGRNSSKYTQVISSKPLKIDHNLHFCSSKGKKNIYRKYYKFTHKSNTGTLKFILSNYALRN